MVKHFYSFIVETDTLFMEIDSLEISDHEKEHLKSLAESNIHHAVLDSVLSKLSELDKDIFLEFINSKNHERTWKFLNTKIRNAEDHIKNAAAEIKKELFKDIHEAKKS
ncbi:MAG TPA: hypothetical protein VG965_05020 [Patescibacteria group bacterium]|nr:hypothetical protein [Patescibacteria group bacterium]